MSKRKIWRNAASCVASANRAVFAAFGAFAVWGSLVFFTSFSAGAFAADGIAGKGKAETRAVAVVAGAGYDAVWTAAERVAKELKFAEAVEAARAIYGDVQGVDRSKPFGLVVATDGRDFVPFAFLPVENVEKLEFVGASDLKAKIETTPKGTFFNGAGKRLRLLEEGGWLFVCEAGKEKSVATTDPTAWLGADETDALLSFDVDLTAIPQELFEAGFAALRQKAAESAPVDDEAALEQFDATLDYYSATFEALERIRCELSVDSATGDLVYRWTIDCKEGSALAETLAGARNAETRWSAIAETPNAVFAAVEAGKRSTFDDEFLAKRQKLSFDNAKTALEIGLDDEDERALAEELIAVVEKFVASSTGDGTFDAASAFACSPVVFSSAFAPADGRELTAAARKIFDKLKNDDPKNAEKIEKFVKLDAETVEGFSVSKIDAPTTGLSEKAPEALAAYWSDKTFSVRFGTSADAVLLVVGIDPDEADAEFARIAAASKTKVPAPRRASLVVAPLGRWALDMIGESEDLTVAGRRTLERIAEADDVRFDVEYAIDGNRLDARCVVKSGFFRLIGDVVRINLAAKLGSGGEGEDVDDLFEEE